MQSSGVKKYSYLNKLKRDISDCMDVTMQGLNNLNDVASLRIDGESKLRKEIQETTNLKGITYIQDALYRNE